MTPEQRQKKLIFTITIWGLIAAVSLIFVLAVVMPSRPDDRQIERDITAYFQGFGEPPAASWYPGTVKIWVRGDTVIVVTGLQQKGEQASGVCGAISGFVFDNTRRHYKLNRIQILGSSTDGATGTTSTLIDREGVTDSCE